ncbi:MAG TPA: RNA polymerase sigma factor [Candidatus Limnocylindrales bacterium]
MLPSPVTEPDHPAALPEPAVVASTPAVQPFLAVLAAHEVELYRYLRRLAPSAEDAADLHQETFLRAFRAYPRLAAGANVRAWLYRIAGNLARDAYRRRRARGESLELDDAAASLPGRAAGDPHAALAAAELRRRVREGLLGLGWRQRTAVVARVLDGLDYATVAALLDCTETTARQHVSQGLRRLRRLLADEVAP